MSENAIDSENTSKPAPDVAKPNAARKAGKKATNAALILSALKKGPSRQFDLTPHQPLPH